MRNRCGPPPGVLIVSSIRTHRSAIGVRIEPDDAHLQPNSLEETRRQARENWLRMRQESETGNASGRPYSLEEERRQARENWLRLRQQTIGAGIATNRERGAGQDAKKDLGHAQDNDVDT